MAKTSNNKKQNASQNTNLIKSSSDHKENRPKQVNVNHNSSDNIGMSKQLIMKKTAQKNRSKRKPSSAMRVMPSLADLEKMFEDSDEDMDDISSAGSNCLNLSNLNQNAAPTNLLEPSNSLQVHTNTEAMTHNQPPHTLHDDIKLLSPPRKRVKLHTEYNEIDYLPPVMISPSKQCTTSSALISTERDQTDTCQTNIKSDTIHAGDGANVEWEKPIHDNGIVNGNRTDSVKTIEHKSSTSVSQRKSISESFSPKPSTSKDMETIIANDKLFSRSIQLKESSNDRNDRQEQTITQMVENFPPPVIIDDDVVEGPPVNTVQTNKTPVKSSTSFVIIDDSIREKSAIDKIQTNETLNLAQTMESSTPSITIDDNVIIETPIDKVPKIDNDIEIIESHATQGNSTNTTNMGERKLDNDDDDCVIVETHPNAIRPVTVEPEVIDLEYSFIKREDGPYSNKTESIEEDDIIDVDAIIALNRSVINKYCTPSSQNSRCSNNLVIDVSNTTIEDNTSNRNIQNRNESQSIINKAPNDAVNLENVQSQAQISNQRTHPRRRPGIECEPQSLDDFNVDLNIMDRIFSHAAGWRANRRRHQNHDMAGYLNNPSQLNDIFPCESQNPFSPHYNPLSEIVGLRAIRDLGRTTPSPQTSPSYPSTQVMTAGQRTHLTTSNSQKSEVTPNTSVPTFNNIPPSPPKSSEKGLLGDCPICMDRLSNKQMASTICGHIFCYSCIETAIKSNKRCPTCRKVLNKNNGFHKIFL